MSDAAVLLALAERCEKEGPSRELDRLIAPFAGWVPHPRLHDGTFWWVEPGQPDNDLPRYHTKVHTQPPNFTSSLDAAVTLVPWVLLNLSDIGPNGMFYCRLGETVAPCREAVSEGARTLVLALCAATLRARAAIAKAEGR